MAIDAICLQAVVEELRPQLTGLRRSEERRVGKEC